MHRHLGDRRVLCALALALLGAGSVHGQQSFTIDSGSTAGTAPETLDIRLDSTAATEGYVLAIGFDSALVAADDFTIAGSVADSVGAELAIAEIFANGATLGVVLDASPPFSGQTIAAGLDQLVGRLTLRPLQIVASSTVTPVEFVDGVLNSPPLSNILVQGGLSVGAGAGLSLVDGALTLLPPPPSTLTIEDRSIPSDGQGAVRVLLDNTSPTQGFVLSIAHDSAAVTLEAIDVAGTATATAGAELIVPTIYATGGTLGIVLDFNAPFAGQTIPAGSALHIANYRYSSNATIVDPAPAQTTDLIFVDGIFGSPPLENMVVVSGLSVLPLLDDGVLTLTPVAPPPTTDTAFRVGPRALPTTGNPIGQCFPGEELEICLYYEDPTDNLQGLQMALCYDCDLIVDPGSFDYTGTIVEAVGAEFVNHNVDNSSTDGDGCELVVGILMDALPPFEGQTLPSSATPLLVGCFSAVVGPNAACDELLAVEFCNGADGAGSVGIENIAVIDYQSIQGVGLYGGGCQVIPEPAFRRGDCNTDDKVDLADAATVLGQQFSGVPVDCDDACDSNDDGKINLADSVYLLNYLFKFGPATPAPGPASEGLDPTSDGLDCAIEAAC